MLTSSYIFSVLISSKLVSDVYGLMWRILCLIFIQKHCNLTVPLAQHCVLTNGPLYDVSYMYSALLDRLALFPTL